MFWDHGIRCTTLLRPVLYCSFKKKSISGPIDEIDRLQSFVFASETPGIMKSFLPIVVERKVPSIASEAIRVASTSSSLYSVSKGIVDVASADRGKSESSSSCKKLYLGSRRCF